MKLLIPVNLLIFPRMEKEIKSFITKWIFTETITLFCLLPAKKKKKEDYFEELMRLVTYTSICELGSKSIET